MHSLLYLIKLKSAVFHLQLVLASLDFLFIVPHFVHYDFNHYIIKVFILIVKIDFKVFQSLQSGLYNPNRVIESSLEYSTVGLTD